MSVLFQSLPPSNKSSAITRSFAMRTRGCLTVSGLAAFAAAVCASGTAHAFPASPPDNHCALSRSPVLLPFVSGASEELQCAYDQDANGLDDEVEEEIARCFAPIFDLDPAEPADSWRPGEPSMLWTQSRTTSANASEIKISINYAQFWHRDGGFVADSGIECKNDHAGDSSSVMVRVTIYHGSHSPIAYLDSISGG